MGDKSPVVDRRQVLKLVMIGGVATAILIPGRWVKPVVNAVIPPAHAAASAPATSTGTGTNTAPSTTPPSTTPTTPATPAKPCSPPGVLNPDTGECIIIN